MASTSSDLSGKVSQGCLLGANFAFLVAFTSNAWMQYVNPSPEVDSAVPRYGLWENCFCRPVYVLFRDSDASSAEDFPGWFTASQLFATFAMVTVFSAVFLACLHLYGATSNKCSQVVLICLIGATGLFLLIAASLFGGRFPEDKNFEVSSDSVEDDIEIRPDWGLTCAIIALLCTLVAGILASITLCTWGTGNNPAGHHPAGSPS